MTQLRKEVVTFDDGEQMEFTYGSGNVFADLGLPNPEELQLKSSLVSEISKLMKERKMTQADSLSWWA